MHPNHGRVFLRSLVHGREEGAVQFETIDAALERHLLVLDAGGLAACGERAVVRQTRLGVRFAVVRPAAGEILRIFADKQRARARRVGDDDRAATATTSSAAAPTSTTAGGGVLCQQRRRNEQRHEYQSFHQMPHIRRVCAGECIPYTWPAREPMRSLGALL